MKTRRDGFTLIELTLAIAFIGILLMAVVTVGIALGQTYQRGITLRDVNQSGRQVMDQMRRDIATATPSQLKKLVVLPSSGEPETVRLCTGSVSYVMNLASYLNSETGTQFISANNDQPARLVRVDDSSGANCTTRDGGDYSLTVLGSGQQELLSAQEEENSTNLAVHDISLQEVGGGESDSKLYRLSLLLGTNDKLSESGSHCLAPDQDQSNFEYCAVHKFETIIRAGYGG